MDRNGEDLEERILNCDARVRKVVEALPESRHGRHVAGQLVRNGTSPALNYTEACAVESRRDFIHKLGIAWKELRESRSWIKLVLKATHLPVERITPLLDEVHQLSNIFGISIVTVTGNQQKPEQ